ncbi:MAG: GatB/YqeY domain-containing protein [Candidatus Peribacteraceae bacterium]|nr:GatB/YqeY domain-containing protein [Candidatus Peribacteraceae bacterium]
MTLQERLIADLQNAIKTKSIIFKHNLKILVGEMQRQHDKVLDDTKVISILKKLKKNTEEKIKASNNPASEGDSLFIETVEEYLPKEASREEIINWINDNVDFSGFKNKMQAMKPIMANFAGKADGKLVKEIIESL